MKSILLHNKSFQRQSTLEELDNKPSRKIGVGLDENTLVNNTSSKNSIETVDSFGNLFGLENDIGDEQDNIGSPLPLTKKQTPALDICFRSEDSYGKLPLQQEIDVHKYMADREMTPLQERMNAISVLPSPIYCLYFILSGVWISQSLIEEAREEEGLVPVTGGSLSPMISNGCIGNGWQHLLFPNFHALPPLPVIAVALGVVLHAPFSFVYHWKYAHALPSGLARTTHWSRRMDQAMIHFISLCFSFATSGSWNYFALNGLFNMDCIYRQFQYKVYPRRNKIRIAASVLAYTLPILGRGDLMLFMEIAIVFIISGWLFIVYPIGGWSHTIFHFVVALIPPLLMTAACELPASKHAMKAAAHCVVIAEQ